MNTKDKIKTITKIFKYNNQRRKVKYDSTPVPKRPVREKPFCKRMIILNLRFSKCSAVELRHCNLTNLIRESQLHEGITVAWDFVF